MLTHIYTITFLCQSIMATSCRTYGHAEDRTHRDRLNPNSLMFPVHKESVIPSVHTESQKCPGSWLHCRSRSDSTAVACCSISDSTPLMQCS